MEHPTLIVRRDTVPGEIEFRVTTYPGREVRAEGPPRERIQIIALVDGEEIVLGQLVKKAP